MVEVQKNVVKTHLRIGEFTPYSISIYLYCYFRTSQRVINSDFDDDHDSPKGEVNPNVLVNRNDISDILKDFVDEKGVSSCLKSLRKSRLCKFLCIF